MHSRSNWSPLLTALSVCMAFAPVCSLGQSPTSVRFFSGRWTAPVVLIQQIEQLQEQDAVREWALQTLELLDQLAITSGFEDPRVPQVLAELAQQSLALTRIANQISNVSTDTFDIARVKEFRQINYRLGRRLAVWQATLQLASKEIAQDHAPISSRSPNVFSVSSGRITLDVHPKWREYLLIDEAEAVFNSSSSSEIKHRKMARRILSRAFSPALTATQKKYISRSFGPEIVDFLVEKATGTPDLAALFKHLEAHEAMETGLTGYRLNSDYQNLFWSNDPDFEKLAAQLDTHYRNANLRFAVSEEFINRMIPQSPSTSEPFSERILGAQVTGRNQIHNRIRIQLIPDPTQIHLNLETQGEVHSVTRALKGGFTVDNQGTARFRVFKRFTFGRNGVISEKPVAVSTASQRLMGVNSKFDSIPIVGLMARRLAIRKIESEAPEAERLVRRRVESTVSQRIEREVETHLNQATGKLQSNVLRPLIAMDLEPIPREMRTTQDEIVIRYRLAGRDQMAANTARPQGVPGSLFNMQIHQSAINNMLMRIELNGCSFSSSELVAHLQNVTGLPFETQELEREAQLEFARLDPIRVDFLENKIVISLNLKSLRIGTGKRWKNLSVKSTYVPQISGEQIVLVQQKPSLSLSGRNLKLRDQLAVRTIFEFLFKSNYQFSAIPEKLVTRLNSDKLTISQLDVGNGWLGISVNDLAKKVQFSSLGRPRPRGKRR